MVLYEFYVLLKNMLALCRWACSTSHLPTLATLSKTVHSGRGKAHTVGYVPSFR